MQRNQYAYVFVEKWADIYNFFKQQYETAEFVPDSGARIPRIIHQIWLGSEVPRHFDVYRETIQRLHPDWTYKLWTDAEVQGLQLENQDLFDAATNFGEKSDILRYELLYRYGGVYLDIDIACVQPLDFLHQCFDFYVGMQPLDTDGVQLGIGVIGSKPGHWLLKSAIQNLCSVDKNFPIIMRTGPYYFTHVYMLCKQRNKGAETRDVVLPATYFYPLGYTQKAEDLILSPESYTVHYWAGSWR